MTKKLTNYISDLGRVIAYYPNLKKVTGSTTASILLCQFLYWSDKTKNTDWIYKTSDEIEEETGLTVYEQRTAKDKLIFLGILEQEFKRLDHTSRYKVNRSRLNDLWEETGGDKQEPYKKEVPEGLLKGEQLPLPETESADSLVAPESVDNPPASLNVKKTLDGIAGWQKMALTSPGAIKEARMNEIRKNMEVKFHLNTDTSRWTKFVEFLYTREKNHSEPADIFIEWALDNGFDPIYWSPDRMKTLHPQAYLKPELEASQSFIQPLPERTEEDYVPMPKDLTRKKNLT